MKFSAVISDPYVIKDFINIATILSKFSKVCVMRITARKVYFIISEEDNGPRHPLAWCELPVTYYFKDFVLSGVHEQYNEIYLEFSTALLAKSFSILKQTVKTVKLKLTDKDSPCLTLEMEVQSDNIQTRECVQDIPVDIIPRKNWQDYEEPRFNDFHVSIDMPNLKLIKSIVERMKNMGHDLVVSATENGRLTLQMNTKTVTVSVHFPDLGVKSFAVGHLELTQHTNEEEKVNCTIGIKKFLMFLSGLQLNRSRTTCSIVHGKMVKLFMEQTGSYSIQVFLTQLTV